jgi:23S rRNA (cytosine1962-C5)-methyltransferase
VKKVHLLPGREKALLRRHPWIFEGAVREKHLPDTVPGETVLVCDSKDEPLAVGAWSPASQLRIRIWSFDPAEKIGREFFLRRISEAAEFRRNLGLLAPDGGCRLIYSESDGLPGVIVDHYAGFAAVQFTSAGAELHRQEITEALLAQPFIEGAFERSDASVRQKEALAVRNGFLGGKPLPEKITIIENGLKFQADLRHGQKTGFYFDLRDARSCIRSLADGKRVLNMFSYTGGFACAALAGGASEVINADSSAPALEQCRKNLELNDFAGKTQEICGDAFEILRQFAEKQEKFDMVILDPPKLIPNKGAMLRGCRAYQDLARLGFKLLSRGGILCNFSCSGAMGCDLFQKITSDAALAAGVNARIIRRTEQAADHPTLLSVPETFYLNGLISVVC